MLIKIYQFFTSIFFDPITLLNKWRAIPSFITNILRYIKLNKGTNKFNFKFSNLLFSTKDKYLSSGSIDSHYFYQDLWAAKKIFSSGVKTHVDVGSRVDGFISHLLVFCNVDYVDIRKLNESVPGLNVVIGSITKLPYKDNSIDSLSCLHVLEHIGLGRYGDEVDPKGYLTGISELSRVLAPGGKLYFGTPVGIERVVFDAHRVFSVYTIIEGFKDHNLQITEFNLIDDRGLEVNNNAAIETANKCNYGCGLFVFEKLK